MHNSWFVWKSLTWLSLRLISIIGESPKYMHSISNVDERFSKDRSNTLYKMDDVVQLQCVGEVENVNSNPTKVNTFLFTQHLNYFFTKKCCLLGCQFFFLLKWNSSSSFVLNEDLNSILFKLMSILLSYIFFWCHIVLWLICVSHLKYSLVALIYDFMFTKNLIFHSWLMWESNDLEIENFMKRN